MRTAVKAAISISLLLLLSSLFILPAEESSADEYSIELLKSDGSKLDPDTPMISKLLVFTTITDEHGTRYFLEKETLLTEQDYYLRINAQSGLFHVTASVLSAAITGSLRNAGLEIQLVEGSDDYQAVLDKDDSFTSVAMDGQEKGVFHPNVKYKITIYTAHGIEGDSAVEKTPNFTLRFEAAPIDSYTVVFKDDGKEVATRIVEKGKPIEDLPDAPEKPGYTFIGWFDEDGEPVLETTIVTRDMEAHSEWSRAGTFTVVFTDRGKMVETRTIEDGKPLKKLPEAPEREGWTFDGWFDENENKVYATTKVTRDMQIHSKWSQEPTPPPGPTPPTPHDKETKEEEVIVEPDGTTVTIISDLIERADGTYDL